MNEFSQLLFIDFMIILQLNVFFIQILFEISNFSLKLFKIDHFVPFVLSKKPTLITNPQLALFTENLFLLTMHFANLKIALIGLQIRNNGQIFRKIRNLQIHSLNLEIVNFALKLLFSFQKAFQALFTNTMPALKQNPRLSPSQVERKETKIAVENFPKHY